MLRMMSLKHLLVISLALNVGLISRILFVGDKRFEDFYCLDNKEALGLEVSKEEAHVEKKDSSLKSSYSFLPTTTAAKDDGSIINLDQ